VRRPDPALVEALGALLGCRHYGKDEAATWDELRVELEREGVEVGAVRRLQEASEILLDRGLPVVGLSSAGVFVARSVDEIDSAIRESETRARRTLTRRRRLRSARLAMLGQGDLGARGTGGAA
jgi:hypothetical protein